MSFFDKNWFRESLPASRRKFGILVAIPALACGLSFQANAADKFPSRPVKIWVPFQPGSATDYFARAVAQKIGEDWKVPVIVDNKPGAGGNIAADYVAKSPADGYTILMGAVSLVTNPYLYNKPSYVPQQLVPVGVGVTNQLVTIRRNGLPEHDVKSLVAAAKTKPNEVSYATPGVGTLSHLGFELLGLEQNIKLNHIPYKGTPAATTDVMGELADVMIAPISSAQPLITAGKVSALAVHTPTRYPSLPNVPTYTEQGFKSMEFSAWNAFVVPAGTPPDVIKIIEKAMVAAVQTPEIQKGLQDRGMDPLVKTPAAFVSFMEQDAARWQKAIKGADLKM